MESALATRLARATVSPVSFRELTEATDGFKDKLGEGATGEVFKGQLRGVPVAVKRLRLPAVPTPDMRRELERRFLSELSVLGSYRHSRVVSLLHYAVDNRPDSTTPFALVFELLEAGSLADHLQPASEEVTALSLTQRMDVALGAASGLAFLHGLDETEAPERAEEVAAAGGAGAATGRIRVPVLHRDIKAANIGLARLPDGSVFAKLLDCGLAKAMRGSVGGAGGLGPAMSRGFSTTAAGIKGTPGYMAPELVRSAATTATDIYAFGCVLLELLNGRRVSAHTAAEAHERAEDEGGTDALVADADPVWPAGAAKELATLVLECIHSRAKRRPADMETVCKRLRSIRALVCPGDAELVGCPVCLDDVPQRAGLKCKAQAAGAGAAAHADPHFVCFGCLQKHVRACVEPSELRKNEGRVPCPEAVSGCTAPAWKLEDLEPHLDKPTVCAFAAAMRVVAFDAERATREAAAKAVELERAARDAAATIPARVASLRELVAGQDLMLHCPGCQAPFVDFNGCNCLVCPRCACNFCAICELPCDSSQATHAHYKAVHNGNYFDLELFRTTRRARQLHKVGQRLKGLAAEPDLQRALLDALALVELSEVGISKEDVALECGLRRRPQPAGALSSADRVRQLVPVLQRPERLPEMPKEQRSNVIEANRSALGELKGIVLTGDPAGTAAILEAAAAIADICSRPPDSSNQQLKWDPTTLGHICGIFAALAREPRHRAALMRAPVALLAAQVARSITAASNLAIARDACSVLFSLALDADKRVVLREVCLGGACKLVLRWHPNDGIVANDACGAMLELAREPAGREHLMPTNTKDNFNVGAHSAAINALLTHVGNAQIAWICCELLHLLAQGDERRQALLVSDKAPAAVLAALQQHTANADVAHHACGFIACVGSRLENSAGHLLSALRLHANDPIIVCSALEALRRNYDDSAWEQVQEAATDALARHGRDLQVTRMGIQLLASRAAETGYIATGPTLAAASALRDYGADLKVVRYACELLGICLRDLERYPWFVADVLPDLVAAARKHEDDATIARTVSTIMAHLAEDVTFRPALMAAEVPALLVAFNQWDPADEFAAAFFICLTLDSLASDEGNRESLIAACADMAAIQSLSITSSTLPVVAIALNLLSKLASSEDRCVALMENNAAPSVAQAVLRQADMLSVASDGCKLLFDFATVAGRGIERIPGLSAEVCSDIRKACLAALERHAADLTVANNACGTLLELARQTSGHGSDAITAASEAKAAVAELRRSRDGQRNGTA